MNAQSHDRSTSQKGFSAPLLSIVIANYNYGRFLADALESTISQDVGNDAEVIICDAASTDNSVDVIKRYAGGLPPNTERSDPSILHPHLKPTPISWWCSEKDGGQSAAFNKGFAHAKGKYLTWLNADDIMPPGCLKKVLEAMKRHPDCEWFTGNFYRYDQQGHVLEIGWGPHWYPACFQSPHAPLVIFGPTTFFSRKIYEQVGRIDESLHYIMDNDLWYRFMAAGVKQRRINRFCWGFRMHEESKTAQFGEHALQKSVADKMRAERKYLEAKSNYKLSRFSRRFLLLLRVFDGSLIWRQILKWTFRRIEIGRSGE